ncbi:MAG: LytR C-terminal domain-containing protein, partial [Patescibacteria group bacterium]
QKPSEEIKILILNGTKVEGLAKDTAGFFSSLSYQVLDVANSPRQDYEKNVIYDLSDGKKKEYLKILKEALDANTSKEIPEFISNNEIEKINETDFIIVLGCKEGEPNCITEEEIK